MQEASTLPSSSHDVGPLTGKKAIVTGSGRGIGRAIALAFASAGADVVVNARTEANARAVADEIEALGRKALVIAADVSNTAAAEALINDVLGQWQTLDILVNNAGITRDGLLMRMKEEDWDSVLDVNLKSAFNTTKAASRAMMRQKRGAIINISSVVGIMGNPGQANYAASKAGLIGFTKATARELAGRGITVNAIAPGFIATEMTNVLSEDVKQKLLASIPLGRFGDVEEIAQAAVFLASDAARYITGHVLVVDGGMAM